MGLAIISLDAVSSDDLAYLCTLPAFYGLMKRGCLVRDVDSVFLSNTYPAHTSIVTGCLPGRHGVIENTHTQPERKTPDWRWMRSEIKTTTLYDEAAKKGIDTCSILWPVTGGANIKYNMPEIFPNNGESQLSVSLKNGSKLFQAKSYLRHGKLLSGIRQPNLDDFAVASALDAAKFQKKFGLLLLHLVDVDSHKHQYGPNSPEARNAIKRMDFRLEQLLEAYQEWDFIILGDHGCLPVAASVNLNALWDVDGFFWHHAGGCAFLKDQGGISREGAEGITRLLKEPGAHIRRLIAPEEMASGGLDGEFILGVEAAEGFCFGDKNYSGQHGYSLNNPGYQTFYLASGKQIPWETQTSGGCITDIAPLAATMLGIPLWDMDGSLAVPMEE
ncbi:ectonucleotide pyrophosphatase/phosphodiesterase [Ruminococcaceae bacterium OttesenSCG-928-L11]|nr:ectonucleotide pyrophosphatase/phosphodiesterase [Ruminococcaceae bacterium OttesenSCG-928-L11]